MFRLLLVALLMLAACSAPAAETDEPTTEPTSTPDPTESASPSPSPSPSASLTVDADLGVAYLALVDAWAEVQCSQAGNVDEQTVEAIQMSGRISSGSTRVFADAVRELDVPPEIQQAQDDLLEALAALEETSQALGEVTTAEEFGTLREQQAEELEEAIAQSDVLREELGLEAGSAAC